MWCSYEKLSKLKPENIETEKYFSEINPKILSFNNNFTSNLNTNTNTNSSSNTYNNNINNFYPFKDEDFSVLKGHASNIINNFYINNNNNNNFIESNNNNNNTNLNKNLLIIKKGISDMNKEKDNNKNLNTSFYSNANKFHENNSKNHKNNNYNNNNKNKTNNNINNNNNTIKSNANNNINSYNENLKQKNTKKSLKEKEDECESKNSESNNNNNNSILKLKTENEKEKNLKDIGDLLKIYAEILKNLSLYKSQESLNLINQLPYNHKKSGLILSYIARAYFEMNKYKESEKYFKECLKIEPYKLEGIEYFSSCLWQLKDQYQLCNLANHVLEQSLFSPETWVVLGNCYSLQKEHEIALKFFSRAIQLNNSYAYAYTLSGHEHFTNEAYNESKEFYSKAIALDDK
jgi:tetratricopeptide (TPR) repeat protein